mmetsp:Transcript_43836/g.127635  ORF Transcript_43836/g.127635 Transcript_43836/m.127635 type:complete len:87 (-) Transcript_43836:295-555(-)
MKAVQELANRNRLGASTTQPEKARMSLDIVAKLAIASIAAIMQHMSAYRWSRKSIVDDVLCHIEISIGHDSSFGSGCFSEFAIHAE